nr:hypothetical protein GCM10020185_33890 [Pseudomonas brassicacearum subsp. brassicacearum]
MLVAGLQSAWWVTQWRSKALLPAVDNLPAENEPVDNLGWYERLLERIGARGIGLLKQIGAPALWLAGWSVLVLLGLEQAWNLQLPAAALGVSASVGGRCCRCCWRSGYWCSSGSWPSNLPWNGRKRRRWRS